MENVPDVLNHGGQNIAEEICEVLEGKGYVARYTLLNAAFYGVPQMRERMFLIGYRRELSRKVTFPEPTHWVDLPPGYEGSRSVALKLLKGAGLEAEAFDYVVPPEARRGLPPAVTAEQAIGDLPPIDARAQLRSGELRRGARRFDHPVPYDRRRKVTEYAKIMRTWPGFEAPEALIDHVIRYLPRDYELFARLNPGDQYPEAWRHAHDMLAARVAKLRSKGIVIREGTPEYERLRAEIVPPYDAGKFPNKWRKMWRDQPARTLMAHLGKDSYSHIHYDSEQARTISVREAARLQSFPDGFSFCGTMNPAFRQIGNAVPPLMALALAQEIMSALKASDSRGESEYVVCDTAAAV
jgi:DNA (cytosine-5)-methyltransferase 1